MRLWDANRALREHHLPEDFCPCRKVALPISNLWHGCLDRADNQNRSVEKMDIKKIELVEIPDVPNHKVDTARVKNITARDMQAGEIILLGLELLQIIGVEFVQGMTEGYNVARVGYKNLADGKTGLYNFPVGTCYQRVLECNLGNKEVYRHAWKRLRKPIVGEEIVCAVCGGSIELINEEHIKSFEEEIASGTIAQCGSWRKTYDPDHDLFTGYDGCEDQSTY